MPHTTLISEGDWNLSQGLDVMIDYNNYITGGYFMMAILLMIWIVLFMTLYLTQKKGGGYGDFTTALAGSSFITSLITTMFWFAGIVDLWFYAIMLIITVISFGWMWFQKDNV